MRQGQQHRRGRSRGGNNNHTGNGGGNNNNRKGQNPLSRTYQSNGPDGKVSGTADGIAAKYLSLARDATSSGDPVLAENYLQHAEHYNRIILAYRESQSQAVDERQRGGNPGDSADSDEGGEDDVEQYGRNMDPLPPMEPAQPRQPVAAQSPDQPPRMNDGGREGQRYDERQPRFNDGQQRRNNNNNNQPRDRFEPRERYQGGERYNNGERQNGPDRGPRPDRPQERGDRYQGDRQTFQDRAPRESGFDRPERVMRDNGGIRDRDANREPGRDINREGTQPRFEPRSEGRPEQRSEQRTEPRADLPPREIPVPAEQPAVTGIEPVARVARAPRRERVAPAIVGEHEQPEFLRRPVRRPRREATAEDAPPVVLPPKPTED